jgi:anhydro-N-acetylmuramic acid kinase
MQMLSHALAPAEVKSTQQDGIPPEAVEAVSFALLAQQTLLGRINTLAEVTGAQHAVCGGQITPSNNWLQVSQWIYEVIAKEALNT